MTKLIIAAIAVLSLSACQSLDSALTSFGNISEKSSPFDGQRTVAMTPAMANHGHSDVQAEFGLFWQTSFDDSIVFSVKLPQIQNFSSDSPLLIRVDGTTYELPPFDRFSSGNYDVEHLRGVGVFGSSTKSFMGNKEIVQAIIDGSEASYRITLTGNRYADGAITYRYRNYQSYLPRAFENFLKRVES